MTTDTTKPKGVAEHDERAVAFALCECNCATLGRERIAALEAQHADMKRVHANIRDDLKRQVASMDEVRRMEERHHSEPCGCRYHDGVRWLWCDSHPRTETVGCPGCGLTGHCLRRLGCPTAPQC